MRALIATVITALTVICLLGYAANATASNGTGTDAFCEKHCGTPVTSCPNTPPTECPTPTECPAVTCPNVTCEGTTVTVNPTPCPEPKFPNYVPCRKLKDGSLKCPRPRTPRRVLAPVKG